MMGVALFGRVVSAIRRRKSPSSRPSRVRRRGVTPVRVALPVLIVGVMLIAMTTASLNQVLVEVRRWSLPKARQQPALSWATLTQTALVAIIAICALVLWSFSLQSVDVRRMTDLGLISDLPATCFIALGALTLGFCLALRAHDHTPGLVLLLYLLALIFMLYATPALVEEAPRFQVTYWLAGHTEYLLRTGTVNPFLDAYFNWPGFFVLTGLLTKVTGVQSVLTFAPWASFAFNLLYLAPMYVIYTTATRDRRLIWLGLWLFYITDWVWQDYFSPQGLNVFFYLAMIAILLRWFKTTPREDSEPLRATRFKLFLRRIRKPRDLMVAPVTWSQTTRARVKSVRLADIWNGRARLLRRLRKWSALSDAPLTPEQYRQRVALLVTLLAVFMLSVFSHPITPLFVLLSVTALTFFRQCTPRWLPILLALMILGWDFTVALPYISGHLRSDLAQFGDIHAATTENVTDRLAAGSNEHHFITQARVVTTAAIWGLAFVGAALRWRIGSRWLANDTGRGARGRFVGDVPFVLLTFAPILLVVAQPYGGEMAMRYYLVSLPFVVFFAAAAFFTPGYGRLSWPFKVDPMVVSTAACLLLLGGFLFARYGNERADYITNNEFNAVSYLYSIAPPQSLLLQGWTGTPWRYRDLEKYDYFPLYPGYGDAAAIRAHYIGGIINIASRTQYPDSFVIFTRSQKALAQMFYGVPPPALEAVEQALLASGKFVLIYHNSDADILKYVRPLYTAPPAHTAPRHRAPGQSE